MTDPCEPSPDVHLNLNIRGLPLSPTLAINQRCNHLKREGRTVFKLGLGQSPFPVPSCVVEELQSNAFQKDYLPVKGLPELREVVAQSVTAGHSASSASRTTCPSVRAPRS